MASLLNRLPNIHSSSSPQDETDEYPAPIARTSLLASSSPLDHHDHDHVVSPPHSSNANNNGSPLRRFQHQASEHPNGPVVAAVPVPFSKLHHPPQYDQHHSNNNGLKRHQPRSMGGPSRHRVVGKKKNRLTVKLTCLGASLLAMYIVFVYFILMTFEKRDGDGGGGGSTGTASLSNNLRTNHADTISSSQQQHQQQADAAQPKEKKTPTAQDFCGMCQWRDQPFNCNERVEWVVNTKGQTQDDAIATNLKYCVHPDGCDGSKVNDEGFLECQEISDVFVPTIRDFCGMCQWKGQPFNCNERVDWVVNQKRQTEEEAKKTNLKYCYNANGCNDKVDDDGYMPCVDPAVLDPLSNKPPSYTTGTAKHVQKEPELEAFLTGELLKRASTYDIPISRKRHSSVVNKDVDEEGLRDRRSGEDIIASVLSAAKYGDRQYDDDEEEELSDGNNHNILDPSSEGGGRTEDMPVLTAHCEPVNQTTWETKPLPPRDGPSTKRSLFEVPYPRVRSCRALPSQWPIDTPPVDLDPFLPWIHDAFPSPDGKSVVFVAQNRRRCFNGQRYLRRGEIPPKGVQPHKNLIHIDYSKNYFMRPQPALFQHVPVKRIPSERPGEDAEPRYRLASHEDADEDGMETRFICRFKSFDPDADPKVSIVGYSLSKHTVDYDYHTYRKGYKYSTTEAGYDNHMIWQSQLLFECPVPPGLQEKVKRGDTVENDYANLYVDVIPIRTAPRYTPPREFLQPRYDFHNELENLFIPDIEWGKDHVLPRIDESGRWENIPVCMPSLMTYGLVPKGADVAARTIPENESDEKYADFTGPLPPKVHKVIACTWAATTFRTRSNRARVSDGKRRLQEWLEFNLLSGFDHIYVYDNSGAFTKEDSLADIVGLFPPDRVTRVDWPCKICSNRDGNEGERSSQYAAESSCRLRFGTHARWLGSFDTDEYLVPMGEFNSMGEVADELDKQEVKVAVFKSSPAKPRLDLLVSPKETKDPDGSFTPTVPADETFLHAYNCNWEPFPRKNDLSHRRKQMYRADYVKLHYVHYSTITVVSQMTQKETLSAKESWLHRYVERHLHEFDETKESTMLHTKTKVARQMLSWQAKCSQGRLADGNCHIGFPFPTDMAAKAKDEFLKAGKSGTSMRTPNRPDGFGYNCFINEKIEQVWWPKLVEAVNMREERMIGRRDA